MRAIQIITGIIDVLLGLLFLEFVFEIFLITPGVVARYEQEPEDLFFLIVSFPLCLFIGMVFFLTGLTLFRRQDLHWFSAGRAMNLLIVCLVIFVGLSALNFAGGDPIWSVFLLPAPAIAGSIYVIRKEFNWKGKLCP